MDFNILQAFLVIRLLWALGCARKRCQSYGLDTGVAVVEQVFFAIHLPRHALLDQHSIHSA